MLSSQMLLSEKWKTKFAQFETNKRTSQPSMGHGGLLVDMRSKIRTLPLLMVQLQTCQIRVPRSRPESLGGGHPDSLLGGPGSICLPSSVPSRPSDQQIIRSPIQKGDPDSPGLAQHAMVWGSGGSAIPDTHLSPKPSRFSDSTFQRSSSQGSGQSQPSCMAPGAKAIKDQGFSSPVAEQIEVPQRRSTRAVYEVKWAIFVRWCETSQVDFRSTSIKQIADFLVHLFRRKIFSLVPLTATGQPSQTSWEILL